MTLNDALDHVHESAFLPELWPNVLERLPPLANCTFSAIFATEGDAPGKWITAADKSETFKRFMDGNWAVRFPLAKRAHLFEEPRFTTELDLSTPEQIEQLEIYQKFFRPEGIYWSAKTMINGPFQSRIAFSFRRPYESGPITREEADRMTSWRPQLARALMISTRLQFERARSMLDTLQALGLPAAAVSAKGRMTFANSSFEDLIPLSFQDRAHRLQIVDRDADSLWRKFIEKGPDQGLTIPLKAALDRGPLLIHIVPIVGNSRDLFGLASWALVIVPIAAPKDAQASLLEGLFDLTPGEARVASALAAGVEIETAASNFGVSAATVRSQLKSIFAKTGTRRQSDLVAILATTQTLRSGAATD
jgi:DNA-binding CsgD family transcriptional regulator